MNKLDTMRKYFLELRCTKAISLTFGNYDLQGRFIFEDVHKFQAFQEHIWNKFGQYVTEIYSDDYYEDVPFTPGKVSWEENGMNK